MIHGVIQDVVVNGATIISALVLSIINRKHQHVDKGGVTNEIRWRMLSGKSRYPEHLPLLSRAAAIFWVECFDPIVGTSGRDLIPVMVYGRNISGQEFGGIYFVVLMAGLEDYLLVRQWDLLLFCNDKTGTLTLNLMIVIEVYICGKKIDPPNKTSELPSRLVSLLIELAVYFYLR
uniref:Cation-transporting P-type ATPase C-terminal domain-containing protein n=1 Tax=Lactuca sativa TaxID=4236 RepID=A0A9R1XKJ2_LACSA|nr:hypothetical protein LSAT_V11C300139660 [Lactuca sativa]